jgi:hypothetical protein
MRKQLAKVAQLVEHSILNRDVTGSTPVFGSMRWSQPGRATAKKLTLLNAQSYFIQSGRLKANKMLKILHQSDGIGNSADHRSQRMAPQMEAATWSQKK